MFAVICLGIRRCHDGRYFDDGGMPYLLQLAGVQVANFC